MIARRDAVALVVGIVVGTGIFRSPSVVAATTGSFGWSMAAWALGAVITIAGVMCYAELATTYPHAGGDYFVLRRALGADVGFFFAWARLTVIPTGSIALHAFVFGDYASELLSLGPASSAVWAVICVVGLTALNVAGLRPGAGTQRMLTVLVVVGLAVVAIVGLGAQPPPEPAGAAPGGATAGGFATAMVFVLLAYGGWNEAAYISAEVRGGRRAVAVALLAGIAIVTVLYLLANVGYLRALGVAGTAASHAPATDVLARVAGARCGEVISIIVALAALTSANATILMGSRSMYAFGRDYPLFARLGRWTARDSPAHAMLVEGGAALALIAFGAATRAGFEAMVSYTSPVFWLFFMLTGVSLFVLRRRDRDVERPFRVPLYPLTPAVFCLSSAYLLYASIAHTGVGALLGVAVLATGAIPFWLSRGAAAARVAVRRASAPEEKHA
ncbi:MAG TPA: amino acid permease [Anaeromyxobacteraceae bacterium]|nr:amino acid permease [Anaeromyxobacteraceae bacterium]